MLMDPFKLKDHDGHQPVPMSPSSRTPAQVPRKVLFTTLFICTPLLVIASVLEIVLAAKGAKLGPGVDWFVGASYFTEPHPADLSQMLSYYPAYFFFGEDTLKLASASLSLICAVALGGVAGYAFVIGPRGALFFLRQRLVVFLGINAVLSQATFLYAFMAHGLSAHFDLSYAMEITKLPSFHQYDKGIFDIETWACETKDLPNYWPEADRHALCSVEMGARWMTLFVSLLACLSFVIAWLDKRGAKHLMVAREKRASWRDEAQG
ncbi:hypothetical protein F5Y06DRAFT_273187 [Hypoxylon sp. FL0890]|nr:hypothetical protein F5Y06DRAFT_273187 [Hypoxylon sp. FL0890]